MESYGIMMILAMKMMMDNSQDPLLKRIVPFFTLPFGGMAIGPAHPACKDQECGSYPRLYHIFIVI